MKRLKMLLFAVTLSVFSLILKMISWLPGPNAVRYCEILTPGRDIPNSLKMDLAAPRFALIFTG